MNIDAEKILKRCKEDINQGNFRRVISYAIECYDPEVAKEIVNVLSCCEKLETLQWIALEESLLNTIDEFRLSPWVSSKANDWSRFYYLYDGGYLLTYHFTEQQIINHLIENKDRLNITMEPLDAEYGWRGPDYDLGWFNKAEYEWGGHY